MSEQQSVVHHTFVLERRYAAAPELVFSAFADPAKKRRWFLEGPAHELEHFEMDFRVGGWENARLRFKAGTPVQGMVCSTATVYQEITPDKRIVFASAMILGGRCISAALVTAEFLNAEAGTNLLLTYQGAFFEGADGPEMRQEGWHKLLERLNQEVSA